MDSQQRSQLRRQRHREFAGALPTHTCPVCTGVLYETEAMCLDCSTERPLTGWVSLKDQGDAWLGRVLDGRYLITRLVGVGGSGRVYRAHSLSIVREFAVKFIELKSEDTRERLAREVEVMARLRNPHLVPFYEVFEVPGFAIVVMDFIHGKSLGAIIDAAGSLGLERVLRISRQVANALHEAHRLGLVHRDIKPDNLMIETLPSGDDFVHVLDFGIVHLASSNLTHGFIGTPTFACPEQITGSTLTPRCDIYALGCVMFKALTGVSPFAAPNVAVVLQGHLDEKRPRLRDHMEVCAAELDRLVTSMIALSPADRPADMAAVAHAIDNVLRLDPEESEVLKALSDSRSEVRKEVSKERSLSVQQESQLDSAAASSFSVGVEADSRALLFGSHAQTPILVQNQQVFELVGQSLRLVFSARPELTTVTSSGNAWISGYSDGTIMVNGRPTLKSPSPIVSVVGDQQGGIWLAGAQDGTVWRSAPKKLRTWDVIRRGPAVMNLAIDRTGTFMAISRSTREVEILRDQGAEVARVTALSPVQGMAFSRDGYLLAVQCELAITIFESMTGKQVVSMRVPKMGMIWFGLNGLIGYGVKDGELWGWNLERSFGL